ncbi:MAG: hypothetical protein QF521_08465 [Alphaproteobacteria bacterium]|nr:hypothetical protein [Alphaproteobacteria bacterium]
MLGIAMVLALVGGMVFLFDSSTSRGGEAPPSPWIFVMVAAAVLSVLLITHRRGNREDK